MGISGRNMPVFQNIRFSIGCASPATGGVIQVRYVKSLGSIQTFTSTDFEESN